MIKVRERVQFIRRVRVPDSVGGGTYADQVYWSPPAVFIRQMSNREISLATQKNLSMMIEIECRYNPEVQVKAGDLILWRGFYLTSLAPIPDRANRFMTIKAYSEIETSGRGVPAVVASNTLQSTLQSQI